MDADLAGWTLAEQDLARTVFERAHNREVDVLIEALRRQVLALSDAAQVWELHDFLSLQRHGSLLNAPVCSPFS